MFFSYSLNEKPLSLKEAGYSRKVCSFILIDIWNHQGVFYALHNSPCPLSSSQKSYAIIYRFWDISYCFHCGFTVQYRESESALAEKPETEDASWINMYKNYWKEKQFS